MEYRLQTVFRKWLDDRMDMIVHNYTGNRVVPLALEE
jgi:hypothetical protein